jgi:tetratricopeptide (TPR) repeat protein
MSGQVSDSQFLRGKRVAFTGKLASMTRAEAVQLVRSQGGEFVPAITRHTSFVIVGSEGWPLQKDGRLTRKLLQARRLRHYGYAVAVLPEEEMLCQLGLQAQSQGIHQLYTTAQLCRILHIPRDRLRAWVNGDLIQPADSRDGLSFYDFQQVSRAKTLCDLARAGVSAKRLRQSLQQLRKWMPGIGDSQLAIIERDGEMLVRLEDGQLAEPTGQLQFDFEEVVPSPAVHVQPKAMSGDEWFDLAREHESNGRFSEAAQAYREALLHDGPHPDVCFNLANVLYALGQKQQAAERYRQALELENYFTQAWNNLGNVLADLGQTEEAVRAFRKAIQLDPQLASARHNLAVAQNEGLRA